MPGLKLPRNRYRKTFDPAPYFRVGRTAAMLVTGADEDVREYIETLPGEVTYPDGRPPIPIVGLIWSTATANQVERQVRNSRAEGYMVVLGQLRDAPEMDEYLHAVISFTLPL